MTKKGVKEESSKFKKFFITYIIVLSLLMSIFLIYVADSLIQYEKNQIENFIGISIQEIKKLAQNKKLEKYLDTSKFEKSKLENEDVTLEKGIKQLLETQDITYKENPKSTENTPIYDIYANNILIFNIELSIDKKENRLGILSFNKWKVGKVTNKMDKGIYSYEILVPNNYKVYINNKELTKEFIIEKIQNEGLTQISKYVEIPYIVKYEINNLYMQPDIKILDQNENNVEYKLESNKIEKEIEVTKIEAEEALQQIKDAPDVLKIAKDWSLYLTDDLSGSLNGYYNISKYLIKESDIAKFAYNWATGVDITFISRHSLMNPIFTNTKVQNFEIYNENAFSCEVYLEKNMRVLSQKIVDKMHERMYFVYETNSSEWKLVNMQSIVQKNT